MEAFKWSVVWGVYAHVTRAYVYIHACMCVHDCVWNNWKPCHLNYVCVCLCVYDCVWDN